MPASYPSSVRTFTLKQDGVDFPQAEHINSLQDEVVAIEQGLLNGFQHVLKPLTSATYGLGTDALRWKQLLLDLGTLTADAQAIDVKGTWNSAATAFTAIKANITDTASAAASKLLDLLVGGASKFSVNKAGVASATAVVAGTDPGGAEALRGASLRVGGTGFFGDTVTLASTKTVVLGRDPTSALEASTKQYVDSAVAGAARGKPVLFATMANIPASGGATLVRVDATSETWYELVYSDGATQEVTFEVPAMSMAGVRLIWRCPVTAGDVRWVVEVREKGDGDVLGGGVVVASGAVVDTAKATNVQLNEATISFTYTPGAGKRIALLRVLRDPAHASDTLNAEARLLSVEVL